MSYGHNPLVLTRPYKPLGLALILITKFSKLVKFSAALPHYRSQPKLLPITMPQLLKSPPAPAATATTQTKTSLPCVVPVL
jgi:hypothetical protein